MGNSPPPKRFDPKAEKQKFEITCIKVRSYLELQRDRRQNSANSKEKFLIQMFNSPTRSKQDEVQKASSIITDLNFVKACNIIIRFCDILKENSLRVMEARSQSSKIENLMPYIESVCWSAKPLNLSCIVEFQSQMVYFFGADISESIQKSAKVDPDLKACFKDLLPTPMDINEYIVHFSARIGIPLTQINACGHEFAPPGSPGGYGGNGGGGGQYMQFQMPPQGFEQGFMPQNPGFMQNNPGFMPPNPGFMQPNPGFMPGNYVPPMPYIEPQNPSFGAFQGGQPAPQQFWSPPPNNNQFGGPPQQQPPYQQGPPTGFQVPTTGFQQGSAGFGGGNDTNNVQQQVGGNNNGNNNAIIGGGNGGGYPEFGAINMPKGGGIPTQQPVKNNAGSNALPNLDDFEERMRKLRENL